MGPLAIDIEGVEFGWRRAEVLLRVDRFTLARGERVLLRGPSGSGKSTLPSLIGCVLRPAAGKMQILGNDVTRMSSWSRDSFRGEHIGVVFQMFNLIPYLSVVENVVLPAQFSPARRARIAQGTPGEEALRLLDALGLRDRQLLSRPVTELSIGQQQRVAAARALLGSPALVLADEPTSALDTQTRNGFLQLLMEECSRIGTSVMFVSHDASLGSRFDRVVAMSEINSPCPSSNSH